MGKRRMIFMPRFELKKWCVASIFLLSLVAHADEVSTNTLSFAQLTERLLENNPQLKSAQGGAKAAQYAVDPARALDNPSIGFSQTLPNNPFALGTANQLSWSVSQNLQWFGKRRLAGEIAQAQANSTVEQVQYLKVQLLGQLQTTWASWQQTWTQIQLSELQAQRLEQIKDIIRLRYGSNAAAYVDYINAQVTQAQIRSDIIGQKRQLQTYQAQIAALIGQSVTEPGMSVGIAPVVVQRELPQMGQFRQQALEINPQIKASHELVVAAQRNVELAELGKWPDFNVSVQANSSNPPWGFGERQSYGFALSATVPLYYGMK
jgi:outer membrane protein, heavy metal efflux system